MYMYDHYDVCTCIYSTMILALLTKGMYVDVHVHVSIVLGY